MCPHVVRRTRHLPLHRQKSRRRVTTYRNEDLTQRSHTRMTSSSGCQRWNWSTSAYETANANQRRISTKDQQSENQRSELVCASYDVRYWFADEGVSGKVPALQRPQFRVLLDRIREGETLVVTKLDRLGRDAKDIGASIKMLASRGIEVIVLQLGKLDLTSSAGKLMFAMLAAMAEMERDLLVERTQAGLERAKAEDKVLAVLRVRRTSSEQRWLHASKLGSRLARWLATTRSDASV
jgi:putative DNA-invertase from lambdoid prophage Rac